MVSELRSRSRVRASRAEPADPKTVPAVVSSEQSGRTPGARVPTVWEMAERPTPNAAALATAAGAAVLLLPAAAALAQGAGAAASEGSVTERVLDLGKVFTYFFVMLGPMK